MGAAVILDGTTVTLLRRDDMLVVDIDFVNVLRTEVITGGVALRPTNPPGCLPDRPGERAGPQRRGVCVGSDPPAGRVGGRPGAFRGASHERRRVQCFSAPILASPALMEGDNCGR
jgi:hypothetical protein